MFTTHDRFRLRPLCKVCFILVLFVAFVHAFCYAWISQVREVHLPLLEQPCLSLLTSLCLEPGQGNASLGALIFFKAVTSSLDMVL